MKPGTTGKKRNKAPPPAPVPPPQPAQPMPEYMKRFTARSTGHLNEHHSDQEAELLVTSDDSSSDAKEVSKPPTKRDTFAATSNGIITTSNAPEKRARSNSKGGKKVEEITSAPVSPTKPKKEIYASVGPSKAPVTTTPTNTSLEVLSPQKKLPMPTSKTPALNGSAGKKKGGGGIVGRSSRGGGENEEDIIAKEKRRVETEKMKKKIQEMAKLETGEMSPKIMDPEKKAAEAEKQNIASNVRMSLFMQKIDYSNASADKFKHEENDDDVMETEDEPPRPRMAAPSPAPVSTNTQLPGGAASSRNPIPASARANNATRPTTPGKAAPTPAPAPTTPGKAAGAPPAPTRTTLPTPRNAAPKPGAPAAPAPTPPPKTPTAAPTTQAPSASQKRGSTPAHSRGASASAATRVSVPAQPVSPAPVYSKPLMKLGPEQPIEEQESDYMTMLVMKIRERQIAEQPVPRRLNAGLVETLETKFLQSDKPVDPDVSKQRVGRPVQKIDAERRIKLEGQLNIVMEKRPQMERLIEPQTPKKHYQTTKNADQMMNKVEDRVKKARDLKSDFPFTQESVMETKTVEKPAAKAEPEKKTANTKNSKGKNVEKKSANARDSNTKRFPEVDVVIDTILENSPLITEFSFDEHPFFLSVPGKENLHKSMSKLFAEAIAFNTNFVSISLQSCGLGDVFLNELCVHINKGAMRKVRVLNLKGNYFTNVSISALLSCLEMGFVDDEENGKNSEEKPLEIRQLNLMNQLQAFSNEVEEMLALMLKKNTNLIELQVKVNNNDVRELIKKYLERNKGLQSGAKAAAADKVLTPIEQRIRSIVINSDDDDEEYFEIDNDFTFKLLSSQTRLTLAKGLQTNTHLKGLRLVNVDLSDKFAFCLAESLLYNMVLESLDLRQNKLSLKGVLAIVESLKLNQGLRNLYLDDQNPPIVFNSSIELLILESLDANTTLLKFQLTLSKSASEKLQKIIDRNCMMKLQAWKG